MDESRLNLEKTAKQTESRLVNHETTVLRQTLQSGQKKMSFEDISVCYHKLTVFSNFQVFIKKIKRKKSDEDII